MQLALFANWRPSPTFCVMSGWVQRRGVVMSGCVQRRGVVMEQFVAHELQVGEDVRYRRRRVTKRDKSDAIFAGLIHGVAMIQKVPHFRQLLIGTDDNVLQRLKSQKCRG